MVFDIVSYLQNRDVEFFVSGKNVTAGWTNIQCQFCGDNSNHLGINPDGTAFNCYICGESGFITKLIKEIDSCSWRQSDRIYQSFLLKPIDQKESIPPMPRADLTTLPKGCGADIPKKAKSYLKNRRFKPEYLISKYNLKYGGPLGPYKFRLIIPFYLNHKLITFSSLDFTKEQKLKYKHQQIENAVVDPSRMLYNIDSVKDRMILVEGITDVWRIGDGCCSTQGKIITYEQITMILQKNIKEVLVMFDSDAVDKSKGAAIQLAGVIPSVEFIEYKDLWMGDPDDLPDNIVRSLRKEFFKKIY